MIRVEVHGARITDEQQMAIEDFVGDMLEPWRIDGLTQVESAIVRALMRAPGHRLASETLLSVVVTASGWDSLQPPPAGRQEPENATVADFLQLGKDRDDCCRRREENRPA